VAVPAPVPGLVLHYGYLWHDQRRSGLEEGTKDRPCVVVSVSKEADDESIVTLAPLTHRRPRYDGEGVEVPPATKRRLGLDDAQSWIMSSEVNRFCWPGYDLRAIPGRPAGEFAYGMIPPGLLKQVAACIQQAAKRGSILATAR
jgi:PemK-like, MazF-like toxin of type II toxin-antitoxin system